MRKRDLLAIYLHTLIREICTIGINREIELEDNRIKEKFLKPETFFLKSLFTKIYIQHSFQSLESTRMQIIRNNYAIEKYSHKS